MLCVDHTPCIEGVAEGDFVTFVAHLELCDLNMLVYRDLDCSDSSGTINVKGVRETFKLRRIGGLRLAVGAAHQRALKQTIVENHLDSLKACETLYLYLRQSQRLGDLKICDVASRWPLKVTLIDMELDADHGELLQLAQRENTLLPGTPVLNRANQLGVAAIRCDELVDLSIHSCLTLLELVNEISPVSVFMADPLCIHSNGHTSCFNLV